MKKTLIIMSSLFVLAFASTAQAKKKSVTFKNETGKTLEIRIVFQALGCAGMKDGTGFLCGSKTAKVKSGESFTHKYKYKWGTTKRAGSILCKTKTGGWKSLKTKFGTYTLSKKPSACKEPGQNSNRKKITVTNNTGKKLKIKLVFRALGCAGCLSAGSCFVCGKKTSTVANGASFSHSYTYKYGTSYRTGIILCATSGGWKILQQKFKLSKSKTLTSSTSGISSCKSY